MRQYLPILTGAQTYLPCLILEDFAVTSGANSLGMSNDLPYIYIYILQNALFGKGRFYPFLASNEGKPPVHHIKTIPPAFMNTPF